MKERGELLHEEGDAVREFEAMHEENLLSNWLRKDERGKEERMAKWRRMKKKGRNRGKEKGFQFFVKEWIWRVVVILSWEEPLEEFESWSDCQPDVRARVRVVSDVTDVPVLTLLWSLSLVMLPLVAWIGYLWSRSPFLSPKGGFGQLRRKR